MNRSTLAVTTAALVFSLAARFNWAQQANELNLDFHGFQDTRGVTVLTPTVDLAQDYTERTSLRVNYGLDAISSASDSCARCHHDGIGSHRQEAGLSATRKYGDTKLSIGGAFSKENFYRATTTGLTSVSRDLANGNTTVAAGFSFSLNQPTLHPTSDIEIQYPSGGFVLPARSALPSDDGGRQTVHAAANHSTAAMLATPIRTASATAPATKRIHC
jgi:hypothetical protein